jgi:hypothetical protein
MRWCWSSQLPSIVGLAKEYVDAGAVAQGGLEDRVSNQRVAILFGVSPPRIIWTNPLRGSSSASIPSRLSDLGFPAVRID